MRIQLHTTVNHYAMRFYNHGASELKPGEWLEVDTKDLHSNYYTCFAPGDEARQERIPVYDSYVARVEDDERFNVCICNYCHKQFHGETHEDRVKAWEEHCAEEEKQMCPKDGPFKKDCFWLSPKILDTKVERIDLGDGEWEKVTKERMINGCRYNRDEEESVRDGFYCEHQGHRHFGMYEFDRRKSAGMSLLYRPAVFHFCPGGMDVGKPYRFFTDDYHDCYQLVSSRVYMEFLFDYLGNQIWVIDHGCLKRYCDTDYKISDRVLNRVKKLLQTAYNDPEKIDEIVKKSA